MFFRFRIIAYINRVRRHPHPEVVPNIEHNDDEEKKIDNGHEKELYRNELLFKKVQNQILAAASIHLASISIGSLLLWTAPILPLLKSNLTPLVTGPITAKQFALMGGLMGCFTLVGLLVNSLASRYIGLKLTLLLNSIFSTTCWLIILFARRIELLYLMRCFTGLYCGGMYFLIPIFIAEISDANVRGRLGSLLTLTFYVGVLITMVTGSYMAYNKTPYVHLSVIALFVFTFSFFPESPFSLLYREKWDDLIKSIEFYKNCKRGDPRCTNELKRLRVQLKRYKQRKLVDIREFMMKEYRKDFLSALFIATISPMSGLIVIAGSSACILKNYEPTIGPKTITVLVACVEILGAFVAFIAVDVSGRRPLLIMGTFGASIGCALFGLYSCLHVYGYNVSKFKWLPIFCMIVVVFCVCSGISGVSVVSVIELLPPRLRRTGVVIAFCLNVSLTACVMAAVPILMHCFNVYVVLWIFASYMLIAFLFAVFVLTDTTGKDIHNILDRYENVDK